MIIGLTGGIACGKSTVSSELVNLGAALIDADRIAREVVLPGEPALAAIAESFGQAILAEDGTLNRKKLGEIVFADEGKRKMLESILHPAIRGVIRERMDRLEAEAPHRLIVADIPLLYESGLETMVPEVMVVYIPAELQLKRLMERDGLTEDQAFSRIRAQMPIDRKRELADWVIDNSGTIEQTREQVRQFWQRKRVP